MSDAPPPPQASFASDNFAGVDPAVMEALRAANTPAAPAYGADRWTTELAERFCDLFGGPVESLVCWGGTGANVVGLACALRPWQAVVCTDSAHITVDECGAPVRFTGSPVLTVPHDDGKLRPDALDAYLGWLGTEHHSQPAVVSISQATEMGTLYTVDEIAELADAAHRRGLRVHLDGARIANAVAAGGAGVDVMVRDAGVDVMTFGATKDGAMYGEAVVFLDPALAEHGHFVRKQAGQLPSKARFVSAQLLALLDDDRWLRNAAHANAMAGRLAEQVRSIDGVGLVAEPQANSLFVRLPADRIAPLQEWSFFWDWDLSRDMVRWMTSFVTTDTDIDRFTAGVAHHLAA